MNILKPQKILLNNLIEISEIRDEELIENAKIENCMHENI